jgi:hypothetical protein
MRYRDKKGRFISKQEALVALIALPDKLKDAIIGELLGDGHLRFTQKKQKNKIEKGYPDLMLMLILL